MTLAPEWDRLSGSSGTVAQRKRKKRLPGPMGITTVVCPLTSWDWTASVTGVHTTGGCRFVVLSKM